MSARRIAALALKLARTIRIKLSAVLNVSTASIAASFRAGSSSSTSCQTLCKVPSCTRCCAGETFSCISCVLPSVSCVISAAMSTTVLPASARSSAEAPATVRASAANLSTAASFDLLTSFSLPLLFTLARCALAPTCSKLNASSANTSANNASFITRLDGGVACPKHELPDTHTAGSATHILQRDANTANAATKPAMRGLEANTVTARYGCAFAQPPSHSAGFPLGGG
mmetsp:Transcript_22038/g.50343  ORF Transcript_22038/g.50343 Transcript_22038/m.50343 type:complete len:229 (-) Transcript_22038:34-720(-)